MWRYDCGVNKNCFVAFPSNTCILLKAERTSEICYKVYRGLYLKRRQERKSCDNGSDGPQAFMALQAAIMNINRLN